MLNRQAYIFRSLFLLVVLLVLVVIWSAPRSYRADIGHWDDAVVHGFYNPEVGAGTTFRWSQSNAGLTLAGVGAGEYYFEIQATAPVGTVATITVAENPPQTITFRGGFHPYRLPVVVHVARQWPPQPLGITITVTHPTTQAKRVIGIAVDDVRLIPIGWHEADGVAIVQSFFLVVVLAAMGRWIRIPAGWSILTALLVIVGIVFFRRGDAATVVHVGLLVSGGAWSIPPLFTRLRRFRLPVSIGIMSIMIVTLWWRGSEIWQPLWQTIALAFTITAVTMRRVWWHWLRPLRWLVFTTLLVAIALNSCLAAILAGLIVVMVWRGRRVGLAANRIDAMCLAIYSVFTVLDAWMYGKYASRVVATASRRVGLDVMRAFAIMSVLLGHASALYPYYPSIVTWLPHWFAYIGVECFVVLSGWLIGGLLIRHLDTWQSPQALALFLHRRWVRTLPTYWIVLGLVGVVGWGGATLGDFVPYLVFSQNIWQAHPPFLFVAWSLSIEEWFYLTAAIGLSGLAIWWRPATALRVILVVLITVPLLLRSWMALSDVPWEAGVRQLVPLRLDALAMGVVMVWWWQSRPRNGRWLQWVAVLGSVVVVVLFAMTYTQLDTPTWPRVVLLPLSTVAVASWLPGLARLEWSRWPMVTRAIQWLALISYPLYLLHTPWRLTVEGLFGNQGDTWWRDGFITIVYAVGAVWLAYRWHLLIERPLMQLRWRDDIDLIKKD
ncbi:MAG: acyltransferase [Chloroflexales bacterium]|nr:acyltransferase [Chloroflexales bacterium]